MHKTSSPDDPLFKAFQDWFNTQSNVHRENGNVNHYKILQISTSKIDFYTKIPKLRLTIDSVGIGIGIYSLNNIWRH